LRGTNAPWRGVQKGREFETRKARRKTLGKTFNTKVTKCHGGNRKPNPSMGDKRSEAGGWKKGSGKLSLLNKTLIRIEERILSLEESDRCPFFIFICGILFIL
jgi:cytochrome c5